MAREDRFTRTVEDAARFERDHAVDDRDVPSASDLADTGAGGYVATGAWLEALERTKRDLWGDIVPQDEPPF